MNIQSILVLGIVATPIVGLVGIVVVAVARPGADNAALYAMIGGQIPVTMAALSALFVTIRTAEAVKGGVAVSAQALDASNNTNKKIEDLHKENKDMHRDIGAVLKVAVAVKHDTGEHKPLGKSDIAAVAKEVVQAIRRTGPLVSGD